MTSASATGMVSALPTLVRTPRATEQCETSSEESLTHPPDDWSETQARLFRAVWGARRSRWLLHQRSFFFLRAPRY
jgi:hypothetical protein